MSAAVNSALNQTLSTYTYSYQNKLRAKLDKDDNAVWSRDELQNYADAYADATGKTLDVNKLMEQYANEAGVIDYDAQQKMQSDDALGFSNLKAALDKSKETDKSTSSSSSSSSSATEGMTKSAKDAAIQAVRQFSYEYSGKLQPLLDKNDDGVWGKDELQKYADLYSKATGKTLDVDKLMETYGNEDGVIDPSGQASMKKADALDLAGLKSAYDVATAKPESTGYVKPYEAYTEDTTIRGKSTGGFSLNDLLGSMSSSSKAAFSLKVNRYENMGNMLSQMTGGYSSSSSFNLLSMSTVRSAASTYTQTNSLGSSSSSLYSAMSGQLLNFTA